MSVPRLELKNIRKNFSHSLVINDLSLSLPKGKVLALLGDNGAGKSTLIKIIAGFHKPDSGEIFFDGEKISAKEFSPKAARNLGIQTVYQHLGLVDQLSIARNFFLGAEPQKQLGPFKLLKSSLMNDVVREQLIEMGIKRNLNPSDNVSRLSGGERQAIAIARARYFGAKLLILDEPTSALSVRQTEEVLSYIQTAALSGISVIFITHTLHHIKKIVDQITILYHGRSLGNFSPKDLSQEDCAQLIVHGTMPEKNATPKIFHHNHCHSAA